MSEDNFQFRLDELDADLSSATATALGAHWPSTAIACALLDKGLIDKRALLEIVDSLILTATFFAAKAEADPHASAAALERFRRDLEQMNLKPGAVLEELRKIEQVSLTQATERLSLLGRDEPTDPEEGSQT